MDTIPSIKIAVPIAATPPTSSRLFQFSFRISDSRFFAGRLGLIQRRSRKRKYLSVYSSLPLANSVGRIKNSWPKLVSSMIFFGF